jgi:hypothetical protein
MNRIAIAILAFAVSMQMANAQEEPGPVEYVRVCDVYGAGWFYIPGTERCIRTETGEIRYETEEGTVRLQSELSRRVSDAERSAAIASALEDPDFVAGERFGARVNLGHSSEFGAIGLSGAMVFTDNAFNSGVRITGSGAVGFAGGGTAAGRAGLQATW